MPRDEERPARGPSRTATDESLSTERTRTDRELEARQRSMEKDADRAQSRAREQADRSVGEMRARADRSATPGHVEREARDAEDRAIAFERAESDELLAFNREEQRRIVADLLLVERRATDLHLLGERLDSDAQLRARDSVLGIVSHDFRDLIAGVALVAARLRKVEEGPELLERVRTAGDSLARFAARMNRLAGDLVDVASIEAGKLGVRQVADDARRTLWQAHAAFRDQNVEHELVADVPDVPVPTNIDHERILQVLANLLSNAAKFTPAGGVLRISVQAAEGGGALFSVTDAGPGIPPENIEEIFQRGHQLANRRGGLGLGLFIARAIVLAHGGRIWAESGERGATFFFTIPGPPAGSPSPG